MLGTALAVYLALMFGLALVVQDKVNGAEDYLVAGRRLSFPLALASLFATWFGAGTLLASADEVRSVGLRAVAMEPLGAGICLILAGLFFARRLWAARLLTLADFYRNRFGRRAEVWFGASVITYFSWIAAQLVGLGGVLHVCFGLDPAAGMVLAAVVALAYTLLGGMWSVTLTDAAQITILVIGLVLVTYNLLTGFGDGGLLDGFNTLWSRLPDGHKVILPRESAAELLGWLNLLFIGSLGNLAGSDLMQRVFSSRSAGVAQAACVTAGGAYIAIGVLPALLGLAASLLLPPEVTEAVLPEMARRLLTPGLTVVFVLALVSAVLSTLDSAILTAASVLAHNLLRPHVNERIDTLKLTRLCVVAVTAASLTLAFAGESAYALLEGSYSLTLAGPFVPLVLGLYWKRGTEAAAVTSLVLGYSITLLEMVIPGLDPPIPMPLLALGVSLVAYVAVALRSPAPTT